MVDQKSKIGSKVDTKEFELPETLFVSNIENRVFQSIVLQCLTGIDGIALVEGNLIDNIFGRGNVEGTKGIIAEQDTKNHSVSIKIEINIAYGISIPSKADEIQTKIAEEITRLTGLHVACVHVVFKNVIPQEQVKKLIGLSQGNLLQTKTLPAENIEEEYTDEF